MVHTRCRPICTFVERGHSMHDIGLVAACADRVILLAAGQVVLDAPIGVGVGVGVGEFIDVGVAVGAEKH